MSQQCVTAVNQVTTDETLAFMLSSLRTQTQVRPPVKESRKILQKVIFKKTTLTTTITTTWKVVVNFKENTRQRYIEHALYLLSLMSLRRHRTAPVTTIPLTSHYDDAFETDYVIICQRDLRTLIYLWYRLASIQPCCLRSPPASCWQQTLLRRAFPVQTWSTGRDLDQSSCKRRSSHCTAVAGRTYTCQCRTTRRALESRCIV